MKYFNKKAEKIWKDKVFAECEKIKVLPGLCRYNFRCHNNAINDAIIDKDDKLAVVFYLQYGEVVLHFVNYHKNKYIDNTLGQQANYQEYYFYRWITKDQFYFEALDVFDEIRKQFTKLIPWWWRWIVNNTV